MKKYGALLFDADQTLLDFKAAERSAASQLFERCGTVVDERLLQSYSAHNDAMWKRLERGEITRRDLVEKRFVTFFEKEGIDADGLAATELYYGLLGAQCQTLPGALEILEYFKGKIPIYIVTNGLATVQKPRLEGSGIAGLADGVFISEDMGANKPSEAFFDAVFSRIEQRPEESLLIGDSLTADIAGGIGYGIDTCWFCPDENSDAGQYAPTYRIKALQEIKIFAVN